MLKPSDQERQNFKRKITEGLNMNFMHFIETMSVSQLSPRHKIESIFLELFFLLNQSIVDTMSFRIIKPHFGKVKKIPDWSVMKQKILSDNPKNPKNFFTLFREFVSKSTLYVPIDPNKRLEHLQKLYKNDINNTSSSIKLFDCLNILSIIVQSIV